MPASSSLPTTPRRYLRAAAIHAIALSLLLMAVPACKPTADAEAPVHAAATDDARRALNVGYSLLYQQAIGIPKLRWLLMFKDTSRNLDTLTTALLDDYRQLAATLDDLAGKYPALRLDAETMPVLLVETRTAIGLDLAKEIAPLTGDSGRRFERALLLTFYNALDEQRHLVGVMIEREPEPGLKQFLVTTRAQLDRRRREIGKLLERRYFLPTDAAS